MGVTGSAYGDPAQASGGPAASPAGHATPGANASGDPPGAEPHDVWPALAGLHHSQYGSLFRLATLLTGDVGSAEAAVVESFVLLQRRLNRLRPLDDALAQLLRLLVARSRVRGRGPWRADRPAPADVLAHRADRQGTIALENSPMTRALRALPAGQREAIVLTHYLDLTDEQAAAAMRVSRATLRRRLSEARSALRGALPVNGAESAGSLSSGGHGSREPIVKSAWQ